MGDHHLDVESPQGYGGFTRKGSSGSHHGFHRTGVPAPSLNSTAGCWKIMIDLEENNELKRRI